MSVGSAGSASWASCDFAGPASPGTISVRISHRFLSSQPRVIDDFGGMSLASMLRVLSRVQRKVRNLDGPDETGSTIPLAFSKASQPYIEIGVLTALFALVALSTKGAIHEACSVYAEVYPERVQETLAQQRVAIALLRLEGRTLGGHRVEPEAEGELALLVRLHEAGICRADNRAGKRVAGCFPLLWHNLQGRWREVPGNGQLSLAFNEELRAIVSRRMERTRTLASVEVCYQVQRTDRAERERHAGKASRMPEFLTACALPDMSAGMVAAMARAGADAVEGAALRAGDAVRAEAAAQASAGLSTLTSVVMIGAQGLQATTGVLRAHCERRDQRQIQADLAAVQGLGDLIGDATQALYAQDATSRLHASLFGAFCGGMLTLGQTVMIVSNGVHLAGATPVALGLGIFGAGLTIGSSVLNGVRESRIDRRCGADTAPGLKPGLADGNLAEELQARGLNAVIGEKARAYADDQQRVVLVRLLMDLLAVLAEEDVCEAGVASGSDHRDAALAARNESMRGRGRLLPAGREALAALRQVCREAGFLEGETWRVHRRIAVELWHHPATAAVIQEPLFQRKVLYATLKDLAHRRHAESWPLFHQEDGRRRTTVHDGPAFFDHLDASPIAMAVYRQRFNEVLAGFLAPCDAFGRNTRHRTLGDLAQTRALRQRLAQEHRLDPDADRLDYV